MTGLFGNLVTAHCRICRRIVVVKADALECPEGHPLAKPAVIHDEPGRKPDIRVEQQREAEEQHP